MYPQFFFLLFGIFGMIIGLGVDTTLISLLFFFIVFLLLREIANEMKKSFPEIIPDSPEK